MKKVVRLSESDINRIVRKVIREEDSTNDLMTYLSEKKFKPYTPNRSNVQENRLVIKTEMVAPKMGFKGKYIYMKNDNNNVIITDKQFVGFVSDWQGTRKYSLDEIKSQKIIEKITDTSFEEFRKRVENQRRYQVTDEPKNDSLPQ